MNNFIVLFARVPQILQNYRVDASFWQPSCKYTIGASARSMVDLIVEGRTDFSVCMDLVLHCPKPKTCWSVQTE